MQHTQKSVDWTVVFSAAQAQELQQVEPRRDVEAGERDGAVAKRREKLRIAGDCFV